MQLPTDLQPIFRQICFKHRVLTGREAVSTAVDGVLCLEGAVQVTCGMKWVVGRDMTRMIASRCGETEDP